MVSRFHGNCSNLQHLQRSCEVNVFVHIFFTYLDKVLVGARLGSCVSSCFQISLLQENHNSTCIEDADYRLNATWDGLSTIRWNSNKLNQVAVLQTKTIHTYIVTYSSKRLQHYKNIFILIRQSTMSISVNNLVNNV